jgi:hypothetical protein
MSPDATHHEYRIESIPPGEDAWGWHRFAGDSGRVLTTVQARLDEVRATWVGWQFRLMARTVSVTTTPWMEQRPRRGNEDHRHEAPTRTPRETA